MLMPLRKSGRPRTVMPLSGDFRHVEAHLSLPAWSALQLSIQHLARAHGQRPTASAVVRAALLDFLGRVERMTGPEERRREAIRVESCSKAFKPSPEDAQRVTEALEALDAGSPLPNLSALLAGPSGAFDAAAFNACVVDTLKSIHPRKFRHLEHP